VFLRRFLAETMNRAFGSSSYGRRRQATKNSQYTNSVAPKIEVLAEQHEDDASGDEQALTKAFADQGRSDGPRGSRSIEVGNQIETPLDYEAYNLKQLDRHGYKRPALADLTDFHGLYPPRPTPQGNEENGLPASPHTYLSAVSDHRPQRSWFDNS